MSRKSATRRTETERRLAALAEQTERMLDAHEGGGNVDGLDLAPIGGRLAAVPRQRPLTEVIRAAIKENRKWPC